jgi:hypothetical protein
LNGQQPGPPAKPTFRRGTDTSCIDLILSNTATTNMEYDSDTLNKLSDHSLIMTKVQTSYYFRKHEEKTIGTSQIRYKWVEGQGINDYAKSAHTWQEFTASPAFTKGLTELISNQELTNDERAAAVEQYILEKATEAKVVKEIKVSHPRNPNKWGK